MYSSYSWKVGVEKAPNEICIESVAKFKGLESTFVIFWGLDGLLDKFAKEVAYIGFSRAKSILALCGSQNVISQFTD